MAKNEQVYETPPMSEGAAAIMKELERKEKKENFDKRIEHLAVKAADYVQKYGEDDYRAIMLMSFLDVSLLMKDAIETMTDTKDAILCITGAMECMDGIYDELDSAFGETMGHKYGWWQRLKQNRKMKKVLRNNVGRMVSMTNMIVNSQKIAQSMVAAMSKAGVKLKKSVEKMNAKTNVKGKGGTGAPSEGRKLVDKILAERRGDPAPDSVKTADASPAADPAAGGADDYSDI